MFSSNVQLEKKTFEENYEILPLGLLVNGIRTHNVLLNGTTLEKISTISVHQLTEVNKECIQVIWMPQEMFEEDWILTV